MIMIEDDMSFPFSEYPLLEEPYNTGGMKQILLEDFPESFDMEWFTETDDGFTIVNDATYSVAALMRTAEAYPLIAEFMKVVGDPLDPLRFTLFGTKSPHPWGYGYVSVTTGYHFTFERPSPNEATVSLFEGADMQANDGWSYDAVDALLKEIETRQRIARKIGMCM
jgi:hypothetical protein